MFPTLTTCLAYYKLQVDFTVLVLLYKVTYMGEYVLKNYNHLWNLVYFDFSVLPPHL
jgi:hypothetical protein